MVISPAGQDHWVRWSVCIYLVVISTLVLVIKDGDALPSTMVQIDPHNTAHHHSPQLLRRKRSGLLDFDLLPEPERYIEAEGGYENSEEVVRKKRSGLVDAPASSTIQTTPLVQGYTIYRKSMTWKEAHDVCDKLEGHLASFINEADAQAVIDKIFDISHFNDAYDWGKETHEFGLDRRYWIGLTDMLEEGKWVWAGKGKHLTYNTMWYPNQPDHVNRDGSIKSGRSQHCVSLWNPAYWKLNANGEKSQKHTFDDAECDKKYYFICERDQAKLDAVHKALNGGAAPPAAAAPPPPTTTTTAPPAAAPTTDTTTSTTTDTTTDTTTTTTSTTDTPAPAGRRRR